MTPSAAPSSTTSAPLPPLPDLSGGPKAGPAGAPGGSGLAQIMSGIMPVKTAVDAINAACKQIVQSGLIPGAEQVCGQIVSMSSALLPMAAQNMMQPGQGAGPGAGAGPVPPMPAPPGGPAPLMGGGGPGPGQGQ